MNEELDDTYKVVFRQCYPKLLFYATRLVGTEEAEDVVQDVFVELWRRRDSVVIGEQILAFLYRSVYTKAINLEEFYKLKYCSTVVYMVPRA